jgi:colanic acid biosynthesis glycosyl transferase WcaI
MKILLYGINYSPELAGIGKYSGEMGSWLASHGHRVRVVTAFPYYPDWQLAPHTKTKATVYRTEFIDGVSVLRCPLYVPARPNAWRRTLHLLSFALSSMPALLCQWSFKPDVLVLVAPTLFCAPGAWLFSSLTRARSVLHVQDFEVDALFGLGMVGEIGFIKRMTFSVEHFLLRRFDRVSSISSGMVQRALAKGVEPERLRFFPNWSEVSRFQNIARSPALLQHLGVNPAHKVLLYAGNIGQKQGLELVLQAAQCLQSRSDVTFLLVGDGADKSRLVQLATDMGLSNVVFAPLQPYEDLPTLLASADVHLVAQKRGVADAVLPSKLTNILAVGGNAVITADAGTTLALLCQDFPGLAALVEPESLDALLAGVKVALTMPAPNQVATKYALEFLDKEKILTRFVEEVLA